MAESAAMAPPKSRTRPMRPSSMPVFIIIAIIAGKMSCMRLLNSEKNSAATVAPIYGFKNLTILVTGRDTSVRHKKGTYL